MEHFMQQDGIYQTAARRNAMNIDEDCYNSDGSTNSETYHTTIPRVQDEHNLLSRCVIHLDVDYFYCQCEEIANPSLAARPVAIGQKHIIVTSNYVAREMGVKKLQSRSEALSACPSLVIIDGSDIEPYRQASALIYSTFRNLVKKLHQDNPAKKGGMDECFADITNAVDTQWNSKLVQDSDQFWIYGDDKESSTVKIVEDQTGATSVSALNKVHDCETWGLRNERDQCARKLKVAAKMAKMIQEELMRVTRFSTTVGISVSPMLAKIASGLKKPSSCNILYPWRSKYIIETMPLRRVPGLGSRTLSALTPVLEKYCTSRNNEFWTCRDLLDVPLHVIRSCLKRNQNLSFCDMIVDRCKGIDMEAIRDDGGALTKTLSVENSFQRYTVTSMEKVQENVDILITRILRLLEKRTESSHSPKTSFPRVIRITARVVDPSIKSRRPFRNMTKQMKLDGKSLLQMKDKKEQASMLRKAVGPLLSILQNNKDGINVTKINLAFTSFADIDNLTPNKRNSCKGKGISGYFYSETGNVSVPKSTTTTNNKNNNNSNNNTDSLDYVTPKCMEDVIHNLKRKHILKKMQETSSSASRKRGRLEMASR